MSDGRVTTVQGEGVYIRVNTAGQLELECEDSTLVFDHDTGIELGGEIALALVTHRRAETHAQLLRRQAEQLERERILQQEAADRAAHAADPTLRWEAQIWLAGSNTWAFSSGAHKSAYEAAVSVCHRVYRETAARPQDWEARRDNAIEHLMHGNVVNDLGFRFQVTPVRMIRVD